MSDPSSQERQPTYEELAAENAGLCRRVSELEAVTEERQPTYQERQPTYEELAAENAGLCRRVSELEAVTEEDLAEANGMEMTHWARENRVIFWVGINVVSSFIFFILTNPPHLPRGWLIIDCSWVIRTLRQLSAEALTIYITSVISTLASFYIWNTNVLSQFSGFLKGRFAVAKSDASWGIRIKVIYSVIVLVVFPFISTLVLSTCYSQSYAEGERLFPQLSKLCPILVHTYNTNGEISYQVLEQLESPGTYYAKIVFDNLGYSVDENCGWIIHLVGGADLGKYKELSFEIRGEAGSEKIGLKAKDADGNEKYVLLEGERFPERKITTQWQRVYIPLNWFKRVNFDLLDNFSLYSNGEMSSGPGEQSVFVRDFKLVPLD